MKPRYSRRSRAVLLTVLMATVLAGCGGSDGGAASTSSSSTTASAPATASAPTTTSAPPTASTPAPTTTTAGSPIENPVVAQMPQVPVGNASTALPTPSSTTVHDPGVLHAAFASAESLWEREFSAANQPYQHAKLVFFHTTVRTQCGAQSRETGPFYCPPAHGVYLNTHFFDALARAYRISSGFAAGYITAHEVAHHVQQQLGVLQRVAAADRSDPAGANGRSIQVELQADCYAGVWLHGVSTNGELTEAGLKDVLTAATVVGDDFQRNQAGADLAPETWTHGSAAQRVEWVTTGLQSGRPSSCDTFASSKAGTSQSG